MKCTACSRPERGAIDSALVEGGVEATGLEEIRNAGDILRALQRLLRDVREIFNVSRASGNLDIALRASARLERQLE